MNMESTQQRAQGNIHMSLQDLKLTYDLTPRVQ
jgi:hypothetical protein